MPLLANQIFRSQVDCAGAEGTAPLLAREVWHAQIVEHGTLKTAPKPVQQVEISSSAQKEAFDENAAQRGFLHDSDNNGHKVIVRRLVNQPRVAGR